MESPAWRPCYNGDCTSWSVALNHSKNCLLEHVSRWLSLYFACHQPHVCSPRNGGPEPVSGLQRSPYCMPTATGLVALAARNCDNLPLTFSARSFGSLKKEIGSFFARGKALDRFSVMAHKVAEAWLAWARERLPMVEPIDKRFPGFEKVALFARMVPATLLATRVGRHLSSG